MKINFGLQSMFNRLSCFSIILCLAIFAFSLPTKAEESVESLITDYEPIITEVISDSGFKHPGIGLTKEHLENIREQVRNQEEPWNTYFNQMLLSPTASKHVSSRNQSGEDPTKPASDAFNSQGFQSRFIDDALVAYTQSILYIVTGDEVYRENAMHIIRIWSQMDPEKYAYYNDAHIHSGIPLFRMVSAAEIMRYSSTENPELEWTEEDTNAFSNNLIMPVIDTFQYSQHRFMNQHLYPLIGATSGYIFTDNRERYSEGVEWFTVNKTAVDQGRNGSIKQLFRLVDTDIVTGEKLDTPRVQIAEMGRDQAHSAGDVTNVEYLARMLVAQDTKVDPITGEPSTDSHAVNPYQFLDNRILEGSDYFARFMLGYDTPWTPLAAYMDPEGNPNVIYHQLSEAYRGRIGGNVYGHYYYYKYSEGLDMEEEAPYMTEMFKKRHPFWWESPDGGADYWLYIPEEAKSEGATSLPKVSLNPDLIEMDHRYVSLDEHSKAEQEDEISFVRINATEQGSKVAVVASGNGARTIGFRIRTNDTVQMDVNLGKESSIVLPDTQGEWKYVTYTLNKFQFFGDLVYFTMKGNEGTTVDIDHINIAADSQLTPPEFKNGQTPLRLFGYVGGDAFIEYDFSVNDQTSGNISYQIDHQPEGAQFDEETGKFSWNPDRSGTFSIVVSASDGTTLTAREVEIIVTEDRESAIKAVIEPYDEEIKYIEDTLNEYIRVYEDTMSVIESVSDTVFYQKLEELNDAVKNLEKLTPLLQDGSIDYSDMLVSSTFGDQLINLLDGKPDSFAGYYLADNLKYYMDFGPSYKVSAESFQLQVRAGFPDRIRNAAVFGSDDKENWTRLTPNTTEVSSEMQTLEVTEELKDKQFRFLKIEMVDPPGGNPMLELSELRIFGERHETVNKLSSVSISSAQSKQNRIVVGDTVELSFKSTEEIKNVDVTIQGQPATVKTNDNLTWKAEAVMKPSTTPGNVGFSIQYQTKDGVDAEETIFTTDQSLLYLADESHLIKYMVESTDITDSSGRSPEDAKATAGLLFDDDPGTITDYRVNGSGHGGWVTFDFKEGGYAKLTRVELLARQDGYSHRIGGTVIQGSHDGEEWTTISNEAGATPEWQSLDIHSNDEYRYIRIYNWNNWFGNMSEVRFHGESYIESFVPIKNVSIQSDNAYDSTIALPGDTVTLMFTTDYPLENAQVLFGEEEVEASSEDNKNWLAQYTINEKSYTVGNVEFAIHSDNGPVVKTTTDSSKVIVIESVDDALEKAENLEREDYSRLGYYQFMNKILFVRDNIDNTNYSESELAFMLHEAKSLLIRRSDSIYSFEGNAESSDGFSHGEVFGTPVYKEGRIGEAIELNGHDSYITLPENHPLSNFDEITVATWVKWNGGNQWQRIFDFGNNEEQNLFLTPSSGDHTLRFAIKNGGGEQSVETSSLPVDEWAHVAVTLGNSTATLYVNGEEVAVTDGITIKPSDFKPKVNYIGNSMYPDPLFNGLIDEFSIFGYVLDADEIEDVYHDKYVNVDLSLLDFLLDEANRVLDEGNYSSESKEQLIQVIQEAESVYEGDLTQEAIDQASDNLEAAISNLEEITTELDTEKLEELLAAAKEHLADEVNYTESSLEALKSTISLVEALLSDKDATQEDIDDAFILLEEAIENLEVVEPELNTEELEALLEIAKEHLDDEEEYTNSSLEALELSISLAESLLADEDATQEGINDALKALEEAIAGLEIAQPELDTEILEELLATAKEHLEDGADYTASSLEALESAISLSESLLADENTTQEEINNAVISLQSAIDDLLPINELNITHFIEYIEQHQGVLSDKVYRSLSIHLTAVRQFEKQENAKKVIKHMEGFNVLISHHRSSEDISEKVYSILKADTDSFITKWQEIKASNFIN